MVPIHHALAYSISISKKKNTDEETHGTESLGILHHEILEIDGPRIQEHHFQIENDEQHGYQIKLHRENRSAIAKRNHPALIRNIGRLANLGAAAEQHAQTKHHPRKTEGCDTLNQGGKIFLRHK